VIISDTSVITNLISIKHLFLLQKLYQKIIIPQAVSEELAKSHSQLFDELQQEEFAILEVRSVSDSKRVEELQKQAKLDLGESEAIVLALELKTELLLIDERRGRAEAQRLGIRITGFLGVLLEGKKRGFVVAIKPLMDQLIEDCTFRISSPLYNRILVLGREKDI